MANHLPEEFEISKKSKKSKKMEASKKSEEMLDMQLKWFGNMLYELEKIPFMILNADYDIEYGNMPDTDIFSLFIMANNGITSLANLSDEQLPEFKIPKDNFPIIFSDPYGLCYITLIVPGHPKIYNMGPVLLDDYTSQRLMRRMEQMELSVSTKKHFTEIIKLFPTLSRDRFYEFGRMLYFTVYEEDISITQFIHWVPDVNNTENTQDSYYFHEQREKYLTESRIVSMVQKGSLSEQIKYTNTPNIPPAKADSQQYLRLLKDQGIVLTALCSNAAVTSGLAAEIAYEMRENYIQKIESAQSPGQTEEITQKMIQEYLLKVYRRKTDEKISQPVSDARDYIELHYHEQIDIAFLAHHFGYTDYYFSTKFREETGETVNSYINRTRISHACELLKETTSQVTDIGLRVGFNSYGHFVDQFKKYMGTTPLKFRNQQL